MSLMESLGNAADLPGSSLRDLLMGRNPLDQWLNPFSQDDRTSGQEMLHKVGVQGDSPWLSMGLEAALDPMMLLGAGAMTKGLKGLGVAGKARGGLAAMKAAMATPEGAAQMFRELKNAPASVRKWAKGWTASGAKANAVGAAEERMALAQKQISAASNAQKAAAKGLKTPYLDDAAYAAFDDQLANAKLAHTQATSSSVASQAARQAADAATYPGVGENLLRHVAYNPDARRLAAGHLLTQALLQGRELNTNDYQDMMDTDPDGSMRRQFGDDFVRHVLPRPTFQ